MIKCGLLFERGTVHVTPRSDAEKQLLLKHMNKKALGQNVRQSPAVLLVFQPIVRESRDGRGVQSQGE